MRTLIVDDSRFVRQHLQEMLKRMNVACEQAEDGLSALDVPVCGGKFDMMFCDVNMPGGMAWSASGRCGSQVCTQGCA